MEFPTRSPGETSRARFCFRPARGHPGRSGTDLEVDKTLFGVWLLLVPAAARMAARRLVLITRHLSCLLCLLFSACVLTSCVRREPPADLVIINGTEPDSLDPHIVTGIPEMRITKALFDGLTKLDPRLARPIPALAEHWDVSPDGRVYTFHLRTNAVWSTGDPITTADVVWSWMRALSPATAGDYVDQLFRIRGAEDWHYGKTKDSSHVGIRPVDASTLRVELNTPITFFLDLCALPVLAVVPRQAIEAHGDRWLHAQPLPTSGAFTLGAWRVNDKVRLIRNSRYWDAANTASRIIDVLPTGSANTALNLYETGVADIVWDKDLVPAELMDILVQRPDFHTFNYLGTYFYRFNTTRPPFNDARARRAFALATDKNRIIRKLTKGAETPASHFVPVGVTNYASPDGLVFNPEAARKLLAEAGFPGGKGFPRMQYAFPSASGGGAKLHGKIGVELQQMWRDALGVDVELRQIERKVFYSLQSKLDYDISMSSWVGDYNDANTFLDLFTSNSGNNRTGWKSPRYDELIREANLQTDMMKRASIFRQAELILVAEESPIVPLYFYAGFNYYNPERIGGVWTNILDEHPMQYIYRQKAKPNASLHRFTPHPDPLHEPPVCSRRGNEVDTLELQQLPPPHVGGYGSGVRGANDSGNSLSVEGRGNSIGAVTPAWQSATSSPPLVECFQISALQLQTSLSPQRGEGLRVRGENALDCSSVKSLGD